MVQGGWSLWCPRSQQGKRAHTYIVYPLPTQSYAYTDTCLTHKHSDTVLADSSQESATTTSTTLLLVNLEASFTGVTWLRRCHSPTNQYHSESSGSTATACVVVRAWVHALACICVWVAESCSSCGWTLPFWPVYRTVITWEETSIQILLTSSTNEVQHRQIGERWGQMGSKDRRIHRQI